MEILGDDPSASKELSINFNTELQTRWKKWMQNGVSEEDKKALLEKYPTKRDFYTHAPKVNLEIGSLMSDIATKRGKHFEETRNSVGSAISALGGPLTMILDDPEDSINAEELTKYLRDVGKLLTDVYHQQTIARKSFITPVMNKSIKPTLNATKADEWLFGQKFYDQVKEAKTVEKACATLKIQDK